MALYGQLFAHRLEAVGFVRIAGGVSGFSGVVDKVVKHLVVTADIVEAVFVFAGFPPPSRFALFLED